MVEYLLILFPLCNGDKVAGYIISVKSGVWSLHAAEFLVKRLTVLYNQNHSTFTEKKPVFDFS